MEIEKIDLVKEQTPNIEPSQPVVKTTGKFSKKKTSLVILILIILLAAWLVLGIILPGMAVLAQGKITYSQFKKAYDAAKKQNVLLASEELKKTKNEVVKTQTLLKVLSYTRFVPIMGWYYSDAEHLANAALYGVEAAQITVDSIVPYADVLGLKGQGSFVLGSAEERIKKTVETLDKVTPKIADIGAKVKLARAEVDKVNSNHYPNIGKKFALKNQLTQIHQIADETDTFIAQASPLIQVLPSLLGVPSDKKYLVLFQNNNELRPTGGFLTAYSIFRLERGIIHVDRSSDIYSLDDALRTRTKAPEPIAKYLPKVTTFNIRDSNLSPDFVESMKTFESMYENTSSNVKVDGIIALDTHVLVSTIKILDDKVDAAGITFTTKTDKRCDCPAVIYQLEDTISRPVNYQKSNRKDLLGVLLYNIMAKALSSSPKVYWGPLFQQSITEISEKHIQFYLFDENAQKGLEALSAAGKIKDFKGDYLHINDTNFGGQKANLFTKHTVTQNIEPQSDGSIVKTLTLEYKNPFPGSDCNLESGGLCLNAELRNFLRIYTPLGSQIIESTGSEVDMKTYDELGKTVFEGFLRVRPEGKATFTIKYRVPGKFDKKELPLLIQKQAGTDGHDYIVKVNGREVEKFQLKQDKELKLKL